MSDKLLLEFEQKHELYTDYMKTLHRLITEILGTNQVRVHSITARLKGRDSFRRKLTARADRKYERLEEITDLVGIRIITHFDDEVDRAADLIRKEFEIDEANSIDKRLVLDPDRFGYLSIHHIVTISPERCRLTEYSRFSELKAEIQTRSILQHAWAEIEHDLGYKSPVHVPREFRRSFSRLAGLLELADQEFARLRDRLGAYEEQVPQSIDEEPEVVNLNRLSLHAYIERSPLVQDLDTFAAMAANAELRNGEFLQYRLTELLTSFEIETISTLEQIIVENAAALREFASHWVEMEKKGSLVRGISLLHLCYMLAARKHPTPTELEAYLARYSLGVPAGRRMLANRIIAAMGKIGGSPVAHVEQRNLSLPGMD